MCGASFTAQSCREAQGTNIYIYIVGLVFMVHLVVSDVRFILSDLAILSYIYIFLKFLLYKRFLLYIFHFNLRTIQEANRVRYRYIYMVDMVFFEYRHPFHWSFVMRPTPRVLEKMPYRLARIISTSCIYRGDGLRKVFCSHRHIPVGWLSHTLPTYICVAHSLLNTTWSSWT